MSKTTDSTVDGHESKSDPRLQYVDLRILSELLQSRQGKCICHLAGNLRMKDADVVSRVVDLLGAGLVHVQPPENPDPALLKRLEELRHGDRGVQGSESWWDFFRSIEMGTDGPPYTIAATDEGRTAFAHGMRRSFRAVAIR